MQFLKKHYEKILLTLVLAGLLGAAGFLLLQVQSVKKEIDDQRKIPQTGGGGKAQEVDAKKYELLIGRVHKPPQLDLSQGNLVFNPYAWKVISTNLGAPLVRASAVGPGQLNILAITPLYLIVDVAATGTPEKPSLETGITKEFEKDVNKRKRTRRNATVGQTNAFEKGVLEVALKDVKVVGGNTNYTIDLRFMQDFLPGLVLTNTTPYRKVLGYSVDLEYPPQRLKYPAGRREGDEILIEGESYIVVYIREKEIIIEAKPNKKRYMVKPKP